MGSYSSTCIVSQLPIEPGTAVRAMLVQQTWHRNNVLPLTTIQHWVPITFPIVGKYDGFGNVAPQDGLEREKPISRVWAYRFDFGVRHYEVATGLEYEICLAMIREDVYQGIVASQEARRLELRALVIDASHKESKDQSWDLLDWLRAFLSATGSSIWHCWRYSLGEQLTFNERLEFCNQVADFMLVTDILASTRFHWHPSYPCGPQDGQWALHAQLLEQWAAIARAKQGGA